MSAPIERAHNPNAEGLPFREVYREMCPERHPWAAGNLAVPRADVSALVCRVIPPTPRLNTTQTISTSRSRTVPRRHSSALAPKNRDLFSLSPALLATGHVHLSSDLKQPLDLVSRRRFPRVIMAQPDLIDTIRASVIGADVVVPGPFGMRPVVYADYTASGRSLTFIEVQCRRGHEFIVHIANHLVRFAISCSQVCIRAPKGLYPHCRAANVCQHTHRVVAHRLANLQAP